MKRLLWIFLTVLVFYSCKKDIKEDMRTQDDFNYVLEQFADLKILRYKVPGFEELSLNQKKLLYYLSEAAICGRDILYDQNGEYNLLLRKTLENIYLTYKGDRKADEWKVFEVYLKRVWFSNGIYHHYSTDKFSPGFSSEYFNELIGNSSQEGFSSLPDKTLDESLKLIGKLIFDENYKAKKVLQDANKDLVAGSAVNFYGKGLSQEMVEKFYSSLRSDNDSTPISYGLNSKTVLKDGEVAEVSWKIGGMYGEAIEKIVFWLEKALQVAETPEQKKGLDLLIKYYKSGDLETWDEYNIVWVKDLDSHVDFINGFIEMYDDPLGMKATWESVVNFKNVEATRRTEIISENAQWFEDNSPIANDHKKKKVKGISAKVINVAMLGGDCYPSTPIGINLPNADWIRRDHGSKSVTIDNITYAHAQAALTSGFLEEFSLTKSDLEKEKKYGPLSDNLHTDLHECLGHGSGKLIPGVSSEALKNYHSPLEETRADLFALYYMMDPKMVELGLLPTLDAAKSKYLSYIRNGLMIQLRRVEPGKDIEQAHMRNRQIISKWCFEKGKDEKVIELIKKDEKTFFKINDYQRLRELFGELLAEVQRIKSEGDYEAGKLLVEAYGVKVDQELHKEVIDRFEKLNIAPYTGFVNPVYHISQENGEIKDITLTYDEGFSEQMLRYGKDYSFLPVLN